MISRWEIIVVFPISYVIVYTKASLENRTSVLSSRSLKCIVVNQMLMTKFQWKISWVNFQCKRSYETDFQLSWCFVNLTIYNVHSKPILNNNRNTKFTNRVVSTYGFCDDWDSVPLDLRANHWKTKFTSGGIDIFMIVPLDLKAKSKGHHNVIGYRVNGMMCINP